MVEKLTFRKLYLYDFAEPGIAVPVLLTSGGRQTELKAKLDTGASGCIFARAGFTRSVLGRHGWLDHLRIGLVDYEAKLYLSDYNDPIEES